MKLLTAIKKAQKKAEQSHGAIRCFITRDDLRDLCWIKVNSYGITIDAELSIEDLTAKDWFIDEVVI